jgi:hypothetical protein
LQLILIFFTIFIVVEFFRALFDLLEIRRAMKKAVTRRNKGYIYAFTDIGQLFPVVKIGRAKDYKQRLMAHKTSAPFGLFTYCVCLCADSIYAENFLHKKHSRLRISKRNEWFWLSPRLFFELILMRLFLKS